MFSLIIPMYNEEKILPNTIKTLHEYMSREFDDYEIVFVDDGSKDKSKQIVENCTLPNIRLVSYGENRGKGCAVRHGMLAAKGDVRLFTDCDIAYGTDIIRTLYDSFTAAKCDVMIGSRNLHVDGYEGYTFMRKLASKAYIKLLCIVGGFKLSDSQCGFKAFSAKAAEEVFSKCETNSFAFDFEAIMFATRLGFKINEIPVKIINHRESESKVSMLSDSIKMFKDVLRIKKHVKNTLSKN
ncbi:MAG: glycosyltransferase [Ruminococcaceae bacterium]|nr:glycosyltransferase [Oscillospiraceae bacterium]